MTARWLPIVGVMTTLALGSTEAAAQELDAFNGVFVYAGGQKQRAALSSAIDAVVADMNPLIRAIARRRLTDGATIPSRYTFKTGPAATLTITVDSGQRLTTKLDGTPIRFTNEKGQRISLKRTWKNGVLSSFGDRGDAQQRNIFRLSPDGKRLSVAFVITSDPLPRPLRYTVSYRRQ